MKDVLIISIVTTFMLSFLELSSYFYLKNQNRQKPLFLTTLNYNRIPNKNIYHSLDPLLGWTIKGNHFQAYHVQSGRSDLAGSPRIMILGGSTTDHYYLDSSWVENLYQSLKFRYPEIIIFNGGVAGYTSSQQTLKLLRDIDVLRPTHIISYDGVNEDKFFTIQEHPYISEHIVKVLRTRIPIFPNLVELLTNPSELNLGPKNEFSRAQRWHSNHKKMHALSQLQGAQYFGILQPHIWSGKYQMDKREKEQVTLFFKENYEKFYQSVLPLVQEENFLFDGTSFLDEMTGVYIDDCHLYPDGQKMIAHQIELLLRPTLDNIIAKE